MRMRFAVFVAVLLALVPSGDASHTKLKHLDKMELLKEILTRYFFVKGKLLLYSMYLLFTQSIGSV